MGGMSDRNTYGDSGFLNLWGLWDLWNGNLWNLLSTESDMFEMSRRVGGMG